MTDKDDLELVLSTSPRIAKYSSNVVVRGLSLAKELTQNIAKYPTNLSFYCSHMFESPYGDTSDFALTLFYHSMQRKNTEQRGLVSQR